MIHLNKLYTFSHLTLTSVGCCWMFQMAAIIDQRISMVLTWCEWYSLAHAFDMMFVARTQYIHTTQKNTAPKKKKVPSQKSGSLPKQHLFRVALVFNSVCICQYQDIYTNIYRDMWSCCYIWYAVIMFLHQSTTCMMPDHSLQQTILNICMPKDRIICIICLSFLRIYPANQNQASLSVDIHQSSNIFISPRDSRSTSWYIHLIATKLLHNKSISPNWTRTMHLQGSSQSYIKPCDTGNQPSS